MIRFSCFFVVSLQWEAIIFVTFFFVFLKFKVNGAHNVCIKPHNFNDNQSLAYYRYENTKTHIVQKKRDTK